MVLLYGVLLLAGLILLCWSGEKSVAYARNLSRLYGVQTLFIGFALLAVSTGIPELAVVITSILSAAPSLSAGDLLGSNLADIALVLGIVAVLGRGIPIARTDHESVIVMWLITCVAMGSVFLVGILTPIHGVILIGVYILSLAYLWQKRQGRAMTYGNDNKVKNSKFLTITKLIFSLLLVLVASELCVVSAIQIAKATGVSLVVIGSTILAFGTSLPELVLNINAVRRRDFGMAIGNSFGSVLEQGCLLLGLLALLSPTPINIKVLRSIAPFMFAAYAFAGYGIVVRRFISAASGWFMIVSYVLYLAWNYYSLNVS